MALEGFYGGCEESSAVDALAHAMDRGLMIDTADAYGNGRNERLVAQAQKKCGQRPFVATKFGIVFDESERSTQLATGWGFSLPINGRPDYARRALVASLRRLEVEAIDLWYAHYLDPEVPVEETVGAMSEEVKAGRVKHLGLSNVGAREVRRAHAVHPITAVQYEYSLWRREAEEELLPALRELGIALVAWAPLGSGFLTGTVEKLEANDFRQNNPRYAGANLQANRDRFGPLFDLSSEMGITPAQLALAWLLHQGPDILPIPGTRKTSRIDENVRAVEVKLDTIALEKINRIARPGLAQGRTLL